MMKTDVATLRNVPTSDNSALTYLLSKTQVRYFNTFGYLLLPGLFAKEIQEISNAFDQVMSNPEVAGVKLDYAKGDRYMVPRMVENHPFLQSLKTDPRVIGVAESIIGPDWVYAESSGDLLDCETTWHRDTYGSPLTQLGIKLLFYLEPLTEETGALRVLPGTNYIGESYVTEVLKGHGFPDRMRDVFGVDADKLPGVALETNPGDVIVLNFRTMHASFAGSRRRRMMNLNYQEPAAVTSA